MGRSDERSIERENDAADVRAELADSRAADLVEYIATERLAFNHDLDGLVDLIKEDETALSSFVQFMAQRSIHRRYATRKTAHAYEIAVEAQLFVDKFLEMYVAQKGEPAGGLFDAMGLEPVEFPDLRIRR